MIGGVSNSTGPLAAQHNRNLGELNDIFLRLASGRRINAGKDDPAGIIAVNQLEAAIASLDAESRAIQRTNANANIVDGHLSQLSELSSELNARVVASANTAGSSDAEIAANQLEIDQIAASINRFSQDAISSLDGINLPDGGNDALAKQLQDAATAASSIASGGENALASGNYEAAQSAIESASASFAEARGTVGAYQKYDLEPRQASLSVERENLLSALSEIADTDYAEETSNLARQEVLVAAGAHVLEIADNNARRVLDLLA